MRIWQNFELQVFNAASDDGAVWAYAARMRATIRLLFLVLTIVAALAASGDRSAGLVFDPLGRLFETSGGGVATCFLYDGDVLVAEYSGAKLRLSGSGSSGVGVAPGHC